MNIEYTKGAWEGTKVSVPDQVGKALVKIGIAKEEKHAIETKELKTTRKKTK